MVVLTSGRDGDGSSVQIWRWTTTFGARDGPNGSVGWRGVEVARVKERGGALDNH
jgi:hypothetical protein